MKLSVIVPCYNCENYIQECLDHILKALSAEDEVICINDGSTDRTLKLLKDISDVRMRIITQQNQGPGAARNAGIDASSGEHILFIDSDDVISPSLIAIVKAKLKGSVSKVQLCLQVTREEKKLETFSCEQIERLNELMILSSEEVKLSVLNADCLSAKRLCHEGFDLWGPVVKVYSREILQTYHIRFPEDLRWGEDICFNLRYLSHIREVHYLPAKVYYYRRVSDSLMNRYYPEKYDEILHFLRTVHEILKAGDQKEKDAFNFLAFKQYLYILQYDLCNRYNPESFESRKKKAGDLKNENSLIREGIRNCERQHCSVGIRLMLTLIRLEWFGAVDFILKLYQRVADCKIKLRI